MGVTESTKGAKAVPTGFLSTLEVARKQYGSVRNVSRIIQTEGGEALHLPMTDDTANEGRILSEFQHIETTDITVSELVLGAHWFDSDLVLVSEQLLMDSGFDLEAYIGELLGERIFRAQNRYLTTGSGTNQPHGVATAATVGKTAASQTAVTYAELVDLMMSVDPAYTGWGFRRHTREQFARLITSGNHAGLILGPDSGVIDIDFDGATAEQAFADLFDGHEVPVTPGWLSTRGRHLLFAWSEEFAQIAKGTFYYDEAKHLEIRIGGHGLQFQSVLPHPDNGKTWIGEPLSADFPPAPLPQIVIERLLVAAERETKRREKSDRVDEIAEAWCRCLEANGIAWAGPSHRDGKTIIQLLFCPFKAEAQDDGNAAILIYHDTHKVVVKCHHLKCAGNGLLQFEKLLTVPYTGRRSILVVPPECVMVDQAVQSLAGADNVYQRGDLMVNVVTGAKPPAGVDRPPSAATIKMMRLPAIKDLLSSRADYYRLKSTKSKSEESTSSKSVRSFVPYDLPAMVEARSSWPVPPLEALINAPALRCDGSVVTAPGYDAQSGLYLTQRLPLVTMTVTEAVDALNYLFIDFPFAAPAHKSALIAGLLTPFARHAFHGPAPLFLIDANTPGAGKSLTTDVISEVTAGQPMARMAAPTDEAEWRKRITALAIEGDPQVLIDNILGSLGSAALDAMLTGTVWQDRELSKSRTVTVPLCSTWYATGNNVVLHGDTPRRTLHIRLQSPLEHPELRDDLHEIDLLGYVRRERPKLVSAALTILSSYYAAGRPDLKLPPWGSYEAWSSVVRAAIVWAGWPDPCDTRMEFLAAADTDIELNRALLDGWQEADPARKGLTVKQALTRRNEFPALAAALEALPAGEPHNVLSWRLRKFEGRVVGGRKFTSSKPGAAKVWTVLSLAV